MSTPDRLPDEALDSLLDGSPSEESVGTPLAAYLDAVRHDAVSTEPQPTDELRMVLAEGLDPAALEDAGTLTAATAGSTSWRRRGRMALRALAAKFAALGVLGKAAAAGAAVTVAASGAGAAGVLPPPAQTTFNEVVGREAPPDDTSDAEGAETAPETPADTSDTEPLDTDLSDDATGNSDGEPGVDGGGVADDASDGQSVVGDEGDVEQRPEEPGDTPAEDRVDDTPATDVPEDAPPTPAPAEDPPADDDAAAQGDVEQRPDDPATTPASVAPPTAG